MEDSVTLVGTGRSGKVKGTVWKVVSYDDDGFILDIDYEFHISQADHDVMVVINLLELTDLFSVIGQALTCVKDSSHDSIQLNLGQLFTVMRDAAQSRTA